MPRRLLIAILLLIAAPLAILGWTSVRSMRNDAVVAKQQLETLFQQRLREGQQPLLAVFDRYQRHLTERLADDATDRLRALRDLERYDPIVRCCLLIQPNGQMVHPSPPLTQQPSDLNQFAAVASLAASRSMPDAIHERNRQSTDTSKDDEYKIEPQQALTIKPMWQSWFMNQGMQIVLWIPQSDGSVAGVLLERSRWVADVISVLPQSQTRETASQRLNRQTLGYSTLIDEQQRTVYRWGESLPADMDAIAEVDAFPPLASWKFRYHGDIHSLIPKATHNAIVWSSAATMVVLVSIGTYVVSATRRQMNLARDQVSFAGHVSHELRTPLTNIRLYADLAKRDVADLQDASLQQQLRSRLDVISHESERLGGLVSGVLDFMRGDNSDRRLHRQELVADELLDEIIASFAPSFDAAGIEVDRQRGAGNTISIDPDILRIIVVNLLGNVEKYASSGRYVLVHSSLADGCLYVRVRDHGPGIAHRHRRFVFKPFTRLSHAIDAPSGTGIGLSIALAAAKRSGGDLTIESCTPPGTCFLVKLPID